MPKTMWGGAEEPTINNSYKTITENVEYPLKSADRPKPTAVFYTCINRSRYKYSYANADRQTYNKK